MNIKNKFLKFNKYTIQLTSILLYSIHVCVCIYICTYIHTYTHLRITEEASELYDLRQCAKC